MRALFVVVLLVAAGVSCAPPLVGDVPFDTIARGDHCHGASADTLMVQNESDIPADWHKEWFGDADFDKHTAFAVALGLRYTGGFAVSIRAVRREEDGGVFVSYQTSAPKPGDLVTQALTHPCHIVRTPKITGKAVFQNAAAGK
ncbi:MAG: protease complex subunit PrcB family protein [Gammaproteobacteria bacterium]